MAEYLLDLLDIGAPYLPRAITAPLYTIANQLPSSPSDLFKNPSSLLPLIVTLFSAYFAFNQFIGTLRWGVRTVLTLLKLGVVGTTIAAVYMGYENVGTEKGVSGGLREAYETAERVGKGVWNVGKKGSRWYFGDQFATGKGNTRAGRRTRRSTAKSTNEKKRMWEDPEEVDLGSNGGKGTEEFVKDAMDKAKGIWGMFNQDTTERNSRSGSSSSKRKRSGGGDQGGFVWNLLANQAKKVWDDTVEGMDQPGAKTKKRNSRR
ncbi:hypothetical protein JCM16303_004711 [Sporobolomyces ruberrimus]